MGCGRLHSNVEFPEGGTRATNEEAPDPKAGGFSIAGQLAHRMPLERTSGGQRPIVSRQWTTSFRLLTDTTCDAI